MTDCRGYQSRRFCPSAHLFLDVRARTAPRAFAGRISVGKPDKYVTHATLSLIHGRLIARQALTAGHTVKAYPGDLFERAFETVMQHPDHDVVINGVNIRFIYVLAVTKTGA